jgi:hypothetical protein
VTALVRCDKELSNLAKLAESKNSSTILWEIANAAVGKPRQPLPSLFKDAEGNDTVGYREAANVVNSYYVEKVQKIQAGPKGHTRVVQKCCPHRSSSPRDKDTRGKKIPLAKVDFFVLLCRRGQDCKGDQRAQGHGSAGNQQDPGHHPQDGLQRLGWSHQPPVEHVLGRRHCLRGL